MNDLTLCSHNKWNLKEIFPNWLIGPLSHHIESLPQLSYLLKHSVLFYLNRKFDVGKKEM
jgi:hypothetical protein